MSMAERIKTLRTRRGEDQYQLAAAIGWSRPMVSAWETGRKQPGRDAVMALSKHYGVSPEWIVSGLDPAANDDEELRQEIMHASPEVRALVRQMLRVSQGRRAT